MYICIYEPNSLILWVSVEECVNQRSLKRLDAGWWKEIHLIPAVSFLRSFPEQQLFAPINTAGVWKPVSTILGNKTKIKSFCQDYVSENNESISEWWFEIKTGLWLSGSLNMNYGYEAHRRQVAYKNQDLINNAYRVQSGVGVCDHWGHVMCKGWWVVQNELVTLILAFRHRLHQFHLEMI